MKTVRSDAPVYFCAGVEAACKNFSINPGNGETMQKGIPAYYYEPKSWARLNLKRE
jgi:hypothetical protein